MTTKTKAVVLQPQKGKAINFLGQQITVKAGAGETGGAYDYFEVAAGPQFAMPLHIHRNGDEAIYVLEGELTIQVGSQTSKLGPGSFAFVPRGTPHDFKNEGPGPVRVLMAATPAHVEQMLQEAAAAGQDMQKVMAVLVKYDTELVAPAGR